MNKRMPKNKKQEPEYHATIHVHQELYVRISAESLEDALAKAQTLTAEDLTTMKNTVEDVFDSDMAVESISGPRMMVVT